MDKLTAKQLTLPFAKEVREAIIHELASMHAAAAMDDGYEAMYDFLRNGTKGLEDCTDEELLDEVQGNLEEDGTLPLEADGHED